MFSHRRMLCWALDSNFDTPCPSYDTYGEDLCCCTRDRNGTWVDYSLGGADPVSIFTCCLDDSCAEFPTPQPPPKTSKTTEFELRFCQKSNLFSKLSKCLIHDREIITIFFSYRESWSVFRKVVYVLKQALLLSLAFSSLETNRWELWQ